MTAGFEIYAPDGSLQLSNDTRIIANTSDFRNYQTSLKFDYAEYGSYLFCDPQTKELLRYEYSMANELTGSLSTHLMCLKPNDGTVMLFSSYGYCYVYSNSALANGTVVGKVAYVPIKYQAPTFTEGNKLLTVYDTQGNTVWNLPDFLKSPQIIDFLNLPITSGLTTANHPAISYTLPGDINIDKVFFMLIPPNTTSWDRSITNVDRTLYNTVIKRVGRTFYFLPVMFINSSGYAVSSCDSYNRTRTILSDFAGNSLEVAVVYIANA